MIQLSRWKVIVVILATVLGLLYAAPNLMTPAQREALPGWAPRNALNLGLDLRGGSYLLLEADIDKLRRDRVSNLADEVNTALNSAGIGHQNPVEAQYFVTVALNSPSDSDEALSALRQLSTIDASGQQSLTVRRLDDGRLSVGFSQTQFGRESSEAVSQAIEVIRRRLDASGTNEINPVRQGRDRIVVTAPGVSDPAEIERLLGQTARLTFHEVADPTRTAEAMAAGRAPYGYMMVTDDQGQPRMLRRAPLLTGEMLTNARVQSDINNQPAVGLTFNAEGARIFGDYTTENVGSAFAILLDDVVVSVATIQEPIPGGQGQISGVGGYERAGEMVTLLNAGALPVELNIEERRVVGAELGRDAVQGGAVATAVAFIGVLVFMILSYGFLFGGISVLALIVNGAMIIAAMSLIQASLSLPGIAGLILTLAMAVDANVIIYERMRDEVRAGKSAVMAMDAGFKRAWVTILDANLTTIIAALIMFFAGAGPVKGFAWTLTIGVITSVFTAVLITQVCLGLWVRVARPKTLPIA